VGQLVAEAIRLYGRRFWRSLALGIGPAILGVLVGTLDRRAALLVAATLGGFLLSISYVGACAIAGERAPSARWLLAVCAGMMVFAPFPLLTVFFILPGLVWLAAFGLVVPVLVLERRGVVASFVRAFQIARADFIHALGSLATLAIVAFVTQLALVFLLQGFGDQAVAVAALLASLVVSPILFLGSALLYFDQAARADDAAR
jgi:hypothetical protein